jgi:O-succinylbenzoic acid--CoA ligase
MLWILSSGTTAVDQVKAICLKRDAIFASARSVNAHLQAKKAERWLIAIPAYHIGGFSILARAQLMGSEVKWLENWNGHTFLQVCEQQAIALTSLVPTQVFDLVQAKLPAPKSLRAIVVGGGALDPELYKQARSLGWPLLPSYGMTETASQVATASLSTLSNLDYPTLTPLDHADFSLREQRIWVRATSASELVATIRKGSTFTLENPLRAGWLPTQDLGTLRKGELSVQGRVDEVVKVLGVLVNIHQVEAELGKFGSDLAGRFAVLARPTLRSGHELILVTDSKDSLAHWAKAIQAYNANASGPKRIRNLLWIQSLPTTDLGKIRRRQLLSSLA